MTLIDTKTPFYAPVCKHNFKGHGCMQCIFEERAAYAQQQAIEFAEWIDSNEFRKEDDRWIKVISQGSNSRGYVYETEVVAETTIELYQLYKQQSKK